MGFCCEGNLFADLESLSLTADITPRQHEISTVGLAMAWTPGDNILLHLNKPLMLSLPSNEDIKSLLTSLSTPLSSRYLVRRVIKYSINWDLGIRAQLCDIAKPFVWYRTETPPAPEEWSSDEWGAEMPEDDQSDEG